MGEFDFLNQKQKENKQNNENIKTKTQQKKQKNNNPENKSNGSEINKTEPSLENHISEPQIKIEEIGLEFDSEKIITEKGLDQFNNLYKIKSKYNFEPRPDLKEDHFIWKKLLKIAYKFDKEIYDLLHQFRSCGCKLKLESSKIKLDLENSEKFILTVAEEDGFIEKNDNFEQVSMFEGSELDISKRRKENQEKAKKRKKAIKKTIKYIKKEFLEPNIKKIGKLFHAFNKKYVSRAQKSIGIGYFNIRSLNDYFKRKEDNK